MVMILPPKTPQGTLEDICLESVKDDPAISCVEAYFDCLDEKGTGRPEKNFTKAKTIVFLSSREDPALRLGEAAKKGYWPFNSKEFEIVKKYLRTL